jgi:hypothetical protein
MFIYNKNHQILVQKSQAFAPNILKTTILKNIKIVTFQKY